ncbi:MAG TPA: FecR domain-containing protein [Thermoanaerobaculia bacterium]|jgi:hypothetical protein
MVTERIDKPEKRTRGWYSVSVASVRRLFTLVALLVLIVVGFLFYQRWEVYALERQAERQIDEATDVIAAIEARPDAAQVRIDHRAAWQLLDEARTTFAEGNFARSVELGERCLIVLDAIGRQGQGSIRVLTAQGGVEYRRGERGSWKRLRSHDTLNPRDWVKTSTDGSAELLFADGSVFTLRQSTMVHLGGALGGGDEKTAISFGHVELNTSERDQTVTTPKSEARVRGDTEALVAFDRDRGAGRFAAFTGGLEVRTESGQTREVGALEQVELLNERLSEIENLPGKPQLAGPEDDHALDLNDAPEVVLAWQPVANSGRYLLRISNSRLFASTLIEDRRPKTSARLGVRAEGQYYWQVAALDARGNPGPWSDVRSFRAASLASIEEVNDRVPPALEILGVEPYGNIVIVNGKTESGATVTIDDEAVLLKSDGSFRSTIQMGQAGWNVLKIVSTDAWNNSSTQRLRVFIDAL